MKAQCLLICLILFFSFSACCGKDRFHKSPMPAPESFNAHFGDMGVGGDDLVSWDEFKAYFPHAEPNVFGALDLNADNALDHDEWHKFKAAHGLKHHD